MTGTDVPRPRWGVIADPAFTKPMRRYNLSPEIHGLRPTLASVVELRDGADEAADQMRTMLRRLTRKLLADEDEAIAALHQHAEATGDRRGIEVECRIEHDGDDIRFRMTAKLSDGIPPRVVHRRWEFDPR